MSTVKILGSSTGTANFTVTVPSGTSTDRTLTLPDNTGTILTTGTPGVPVNGPAFSAYATSATSVSASTWTKVTVDTEEFDTNSNFASSRFTPTVAGYYQVSGSIVYTSTSGMNGAGIAKNGSLFKNSNFIPATTVGMSSGISVLVYLNGSTDYVELYTYQTNGTQNTSPSVGNVWFTGALVRGA